MINRILERLSTQTSDDLTKGEVKLPDGRIVEVNWYSDSDSLQIGKATRITGEIKLNKSIISDMSENGRNYVISHELGHTERRQSTRILSKVFLFAGIFMAILFILLVVLGNFDVSSVNVINSIKYALVSTTFVVIMFRLEELAAEIYSLRQIGESGFLNGYEETTEIGVEPSIAEKIITRVLYPRPSEVLWWNRVLTRLKWFSFP